MNSIGVNQFSGPRRSLKALVISWTAALISVLLLWPAGQIMVADLMAFRSCSVNSSGLSISACGKTGFGVTDLMLVGIFVGVLAIAVSALTHAWRVTKRPA